MNNTTTTTTSDSTAQDNTSFGGELALIFGVTIGCLSVIFIVAVVATFFCTRKKTVDDGGSISTDDEIDQDCHSVILEMGGIDDAVLNTYPKLLYSEAVKAKLDKQGGDGDGDGGASNMASCCSICLAEFLQEDMLRHLPDCDHLFHVQCIDPWLKMHLSCPICRKLAIQSPRNIAEAAPATASRENRRPFFDQRFVQ